VNFLSEPLGDEPVQTQEQFDQQSLTEHLRELRSCLLIAFAAVAAGFAVAYSFVQPLADWFLRPLIKVLPPGKSLIFMSYQEGFFFI
jgi:Sec-independent protein secretion pathway component TatC